MPTPWFSLTISTEAKAAMRDVLLPEDFQQVMASIQMALDRRQEMIQTYISEHGTPKGDRLRMLLTGKRREANGVREGTET